MAVDPADALTTNDTDPVPVDEVVPDPDEALSTDEVDAVPVEDPVISEDDVLTTDETPPVDWTGEPAEGAQHRKTKAKATDDDDEPDVATASRTVAKSSATNSKGATKK